MTTREVLGQSAFEGLGQSPQLDLSRQQTFAQIARPEFWGVEPRSLTEVDYRDMELVTPDRLRASLIGIKLDRPSSVAYRGEHGSLINVALTPEEYGLVAGSIERLGERAVNKTLAARPARANFGLDVAAAHRAGVHTLERYSEKMGRYIDKTLVPDIGFMDSLAEYIAHPGLQRLRGDNYLMSLGWFREHMVRDVLVALQRQRDWTPEQQAQALRALDSRLLMDRANNQHLKNWAETVDFFREYWGHKLALFKTKQYEAKRYTHRHGPSS